MLDEYRSTVLAPKPRRRRETAPLASHKPWHVTRELAPLKKTIHGWRRADLLAHLDIAPWAMSRQLKRLHVLELTKEVAPTDRYYLTQTGRSALPPPAL